MVALTYRVPVVLLLQLVLEALLVFAAFIVAAMPQNFRGGLPGTEFYGAGTMFAVALVTASGAFAGNVQTNPTNIDGSLIDFNSHFHFIELAWDHSACTKKTGLKQFSFNAPGAFMIADDGFLP